MMSVQKLDLSNIEERLKKRGWEPSRVADAISNYRVFLSDIQESKKIRMTSCDVDEIWHEHILHTRQYADDCEALFGAFLHHTPSTEKIVDFSSNNKSLCVPTIELCVPTIQPN